MKQIALWFTFLILVVNSFLNCQSSPKKDLNLIYCGSEKVAVIATKSPKKPKWVWVAADSPEIPKEAHNWFRTTDECKSYGQQLLITASSGGIAFIDRSNKSCSFFGYAKNTHSACLLPNHQIAVASSFGGDELIIFDRVRSGKNIKAAARLPLIGAHGVHWDGKNKCLWALGNTELLKLKINNTNNKTTLTTVKKYTLPSSGGHDLSLGPNDNVFYISTRKHLYLFNKTKGTFTSDAKLGNASNIKSIDVNRQNQETVYHQGSAKSWWSHVIRFRNSQKTIVLEDEIVYKVRWDQAQPLP